MKSSHCILLVLTLVSCNRKPIDIPDTPDASAFKVGIEMCTDIKDQASSILVYLEEGDRSSHYSAQVEIDGKACFDKERQLDFTGSTISRILLPDIIPGMRRAIVRISSADEEVTTELSFVEPVRHPEITLSLDYNPGSGNYEFSVNDNPYGIAIRVASKLSISGYASYYKGNEHGWSLDDPWYHRASDTQTIHDERVLECDSEGLFCLAEKDKLSRQMTSMYILSAIWRQSSGSDDYSYYIMGYEPVFYTIVKETFSVSFQFDTIPGVYPVLKNNIQGCTVEGIDQKN